MSCVESDRRMRHKFVQRVRYLNGNIYCNKGGYFCDNTIYLERDCYIVKNVIAREIAFYSNLFPHLISSLEEKII